MLHSTTKILDNVARAEDGSARRLSSRCICKNSGTESVRYAKLGTYDGPPQLEDVIIRESYSICMLRRVREIFCLLAKQLAMTKSIEVARVVAGDQAAPYKPADVAQNRAEDDCPYRRLEPALHVVGDSCERRSVVVNREKGAKLKTPQ